MIKRRRNELTDNLFNGYASKLSEQLLAFDWSSVQRLAEELLSVWQSRGHVFLCGNGGSAANAIHLANDFIYGIAKNGYGMNAYDLSSNPSVLTCLANDISYEQVYAYQVRIMAEPSDLLLVFSGSGNSSNVVNAVETARDIGMKTAAIIGYSGGALLPMVDIAVHFPVHDMQMIEDFQQIVGHALMKWLAERAEQVL